MSDDTLPRIEEDRYRSLPIPDAAKALSEASGQVITAAMLQSDVAEGAPTNPDGTLNLIHYAAWLLKGRHGD